MVNDEMCAHVHVITCMCYASHLRKSTSECQLSINALNTCPTLVFPPFDTQVSCLTMGLDMTVRAHVTTSSYSEECDAARLTLLKMHPVLHQ
jgi:hypothetical protein